MRICAILPAFNEAGSIEKIIKEIKSNDIEVIVIDDGSDDKTKEQAKQQGAHVISHAKRRGKGVSLKDGFNYALSNNYDIIITMDADGQHEPLDIPKFIGRAKERQASVVIGNRMSNPTGMPAIRIFTNKLMSFVVSVVCRQNIPDTQCGYRLYTKEAISGISIKARKFEIDSELLIKLARKGYKIESVPIRSIYADERSKIRPIRDTFRFLGFLIKSLFKR
ncbi:MAG: glycosyltransferase family 2 protein [Candidatus Omnitrophica bacterium]|nr:glycosyltransferase family 2 protein [Candidatus Omnitrophota bacterium]